MTGVPSVEEIKGSVTSRITPRRRYWRASYLGQEVATRNTHQGKIPSQELRNLSKESICTETGLLGHVTRGARSGNSLRVHLGHLGDHRYGKRTAHPPPASVLARGGPS